MSKCDKCGEESELMTLIEVAEYLKIAKRTAYGWVKSGELPGFKVGNAWRFDKADIQKWVLAQKKRDQQLR